MYLNHIDNIIDKKAFHSKEKQICKIDRIIASKIKRDTKQEVFLIKWKGKRTRRNSWEPKNHISESAIAQYKNNLTKVQTVRNDNKSHNKPDAWFAETDHLVDVIDTTEQPYIPEALKLLNECDNTDFIELTLNPEFESGIKSCKDGSNCNKFYDTTCGMYVSYIILL